MQPFSPPVHRIALLIGTLEYGEDSRLKTLKGPKHDLRHMEHQLQAADFAVRVVESRSDTNATGHDLKRAIRDNGLQLLSGIDRSQTFAVCYYSGHGAMNAMISSSGDHVSFSVLKELFTNVEWTLILADACRTVDTSSGGSSSTITKQRDPGICVTEADIVGFSTAHHYLIGLSCPDGAQALDAENSDECSTYTAQLVFEDRVSVFDTVERAAAATAATGPLVIQSSEGRQQFKRFSLIRSLRANNNFIGSTAASMLGRDNECKMVETALKKGGLCLIHGPPGEGKTLLALHAAIRLQNTFPAGIYPVDMRGCNTSDDHEVAKELMCKHVAKQLVPLLKQANNVIEGSADDWQSVMRWVDKEYEQSLIIVDNAEVVMHEQELLWHLLRELMQRKLVSVAITSQRNPNWNRGEIIVELCGLEPSVAVDLLQQQLCEPDYSKYDVVQLADRYHCNPLVLQFVAGVVKLGGCTLQEALQHGPLTALQKGTICDARSGTGLHVDRLIHTWKRLDQGCLDPGRMEAVAQLAVFPGKFSQKAAMAVVTKLALHQEEGIFQDLLAMGVLQRAGSTNHKAQGQQILYRMHPLHREAGYQILEGLADREAEAKEGFEQYVLSLAEALDPLTPATARPILQQEAHNIAHVVRVANAMSEQCPDKRLEKAERLRKLAVYLWRCTMLPLADRLLQLALIITQQVSGLAAIQSVRLSLERAALLTALAMEGREPRERTRAMLNDAEELLQATLSAVEAQYLNGTSATADRATSTTAGWLARTGSLTSTKPGSQHDHTSGSSSSGTITGICDSSHTPAETAPSSAAEDKRSALLVSAAIKCSLAGAYMGRGKLSSAVKVAQEVWAVHEKYLEPHHMCRINTMLQLARMYEVQGRHRDAADFAMRALEASKAVGPHLLTALSLTFLSKLMLQMGTPGAVQYVQEAHEWYKARPNNMWRSANLKHFYDKVHPMQCDLALGSRYEDLDWSASSRLQQAKRCEEAALATPAGPFFIVELTILLGHSSEELHRAAAGRILKDILAVIEVAEGPYSPAVMPFRAALHGIARQAGRQASAELLKVVECARFLSECKEQPAPVGARLAREQMPYMQRIEQAQDLQMQQIALMEQAQHLQQQGQLEEAEKVLRIILQMHSDLLDEEHPAIVGGLCALAANLHVQGGPAKATEAVECIKKARDIVQRVAEGNVVVLASVMQQLSAVEKDMGLPDIAEQTARKILKMLQKEAQQHESDSTEHQAVIAAKVHLAELLKQEGTQWQFDRIADPAKLAEAEELLQEALQWRSGEVGFFSAHMSVQSNLCDVFYKQGRYDEAEQLCRKVIQLASTKIGPEHPLLVPERCRLGKILVAQGKLREAISQLQQAVTMERTTGTAWRLPVPLYELFKALHLDGQIKEAAQAIQEAIAIAKGFGPKHPLYLELSQRPLSFIGETCGRWLQGTTTRVFSWAALPYWVPGVVVLLAPWMVGGTFRTAGLISSELTGLGPLATALATLVAAVSFGWSYNKQPLVLLLVCILLVVPVWWAVAIVAILIIHLAAFWCGRWCADRHGAYGPITRLCVTQQMAAVYVVLLINLMVMCAVRWG